MYNSFSDSELMSRFRHYNGIVQGRDTISLDELSRRAGLPYDTVLRDLQRILQRSWFGDGAYINYLSKTLVIRVPEAGSAEKRQAAPVSGAASQDGTYHYSFRPQPVTTMRASERMGVRPAAAKTTARTPSVTPSGKLNVPAVKDKSKGWRVALYTWGGIAAIVTLAMLGDTVDSITWGGFSYFVENLLNTAIWGGMSVGSFAVSNLLLKRSRRMRSYPNIQAGRSAVPIAELSQASGVSESRVKKDLEKMIDDGQWGPGAYIDNTNNVLYLNYTQPQRTAAPAPAENVPVSAPAPSEKEKAAPAAGKDEYAEILQEIRTLNDSITDPGVSKKISEIEDITAKIFRIVDEKPEKKSEIKSFMSYYLPTTLKLLRSYSTFERQGVGGENIDSAKKDIERILDTLVVGFTQQLDQLFKTDVLDISSDIEVLEQMMKKDGLSEADDFEGLTLGGV